MSFLANIIWFIFGGWYTDYKDKEKALIQGYECSEDLELYITKED